MSEANILIFRRGFAWCFGESRESKVRNKKIRGEPTISLAWHKVQSATERHTWDEVLDAKTPCQGIKYGQSPGGGVVDSTFPPAAAAAPGTGRPDIERIKPKQKPEPIPFLRLHTYCTKV